MTPDVLGVECTPALVDVSWVVRKHLDVPYAGGSPDQGLDLHLPRTGDGPFPLLIYIHGGAFYGGDKRDRHLEG